ncbi:MAG: hypothetical protein WC919_03010 [Candidatus Paceibacterota bacterium]|jgi:hypothetical protein
MDSTREEHESFGLVGFSRISHGGAVGGTNLFGSAICHHHTIALRIKKATKERRLHDDRYYGGETIIEVEMSPNQFSEAITTMNVGDGVPCTIRRIGKKGMADCPEETMRQVFEEEFKQACVKTSDMACELVKQAQAILNQKTIKVSERKELLEVLRRIQQNLQSNLPFIGTQFNEAMDDVVADAKGAVEAFFTHRINDLGIQAIQQGAPDMRMLGQTSDDKDILDGKATDCSNSPTGDDYEEGRQQR